MALSSATKAEIEKGLRLGKFGQLTDAESSALDRSKLVHVFLMVLYVLIIVKGLVRVTVLRIVSAATLANRFPCDPPHVKQFAPWGFFAIGASIEAFQPPTAAAERCIGVGMAIGSSILGFALMIGGQMAAAGVYT